MVHVPRRYISTRGTLDDELLKACPDCGHPWLAHQTLQASGNNASLSPWHWCEYSMKKDDANEHGRGGTLAKSCGCTNTLDALRAANVWVTAPVESEPHNA